MFLFDGTLKVFLVGFFFMQTSIITLICILYSHSFCTKSWRRAGSPSLTSRRNSLKKNMKKKSKKKSISWQGYILYLYCAFRSSCPPPFHIRDTFFFRVHSSIYDQKEVIFEAFFFYPSSPFSFSHLPFFP